MFYHIPLSTITLILLLNSRLCTPFSYSSITNKIPSLNTATTTAARVIISSSTTVEGGLQQQQKGRSPIIISASTANNEQDSSSSPAPAPSSSLSPSSEIIVPSLSSRLGGLDKATVWHEFTPLSDKHNAINLGQGFPDWDPPPFTIQAMTNAITTRRANQYARPNAHLPLAEILAADASSSFATWGGETTVDPTTMVATAVGCTNALFCALQGLIGEGDEVLLLEPAFDLYLAQVSMAGGTIRTVPLRYSLHHNNNDDDDDNDTQHGGPPPPLDANKVFTIDFDELERAITPQTKVMILNTPHNPTGKMFSREEMETLADIVRRYEHLTIITDEVYEHIVFDDVQSPHIHFASLPGMFERTLTLNSSGKTFSATGWKVGWAIGPPHLIRAVTSVQQWCNFSSPTPNQDAIAQCLLAAKEPYYYGDDSFDNYYHYLKDSYRRKRDLLVSALSSTTVITPIVPSGGFFVMGETSRWDDFEWDETMATIARPEGSMPRDWALCRYLTQEVGVAAIPPSAFYRVESVGLAKDLVRLAYCKSDEVLMEAGRRMERYFEERRRKTGVDD